jgi:hypothetical protein
MKSLLTLFVAGLLPLSLLAQHRTAPSNSIITRIKQEGFDNSKVMETVFQLTDVSGPRLTGSPGLMRAENWAKSQLDSFGLKNAHLEAWGGFGQGWETKKSYVALTAPYYQPLIAVPKAWTPGTNGPIAADAVLLRIAKQEDFENYAGKLSGKIVVLAPDNTELRMNFKADAHRMDDDELKDLKSDPRMDDPGEPYQGPTREQRRAQAMLRQRIDSFLQAQGVKAWVVGTRGSMGTVFTTNGAPYAWNAKPVLPCLEMSMEDVNRLTRLLDAKIPARMEMEIDNRMYKTDSTAYNVIAEIPGTDKELKDEVVMLGAHIDSWHAATGTTDNAAGVAVVMEAVRILKALNVQPRRTIRIALWSGEEQGVLGSKGYVKQHFGDPVTMQLKPEQERISAYYNLDNGAGRIRGIFAQGNDEVVPIFMDWMKPFEDLGANTVTLRNTGSTDHIPFDALGIPAFQFIQDPLEYGSRTHHSNMDTYDRVNRADLMQAAVIMASFVYNTAMRADMLPRKPLPKPHS